ncbi:hypothetical protein Tco_1194959 [Tanacetum coccineum]
MASTFGSMSKSFMTMSLPPQDEQLTNRPVDFTKLVKAISLPQDVLSTFDRCHIKLEHQVQCLIEVYIGPMQPTQVNEVTSSCEICSGPYDTQYCMENPEKPHNSNEFHVYQLPYKRGASRQGNQNTHSSINTITIHPKQQSDSRNTKVEEEEIKREGNPEDTNSIAHNEEQRDTLQLELKDTTAVDNLGSNRDDEGIEWLDVEEPLDLVNTSEESVYESLIKEIPKCSLNYDFRIKKGDPRNLKIPCMIGLGRDMHVFVGNMSYVIDFTILENIETNVDPSLSYVIFDEKKLVSSKEVSLDDSWRMI